MSKYLSDYYSFPGFDAEDLEQEAKVIGLAALQKFNKDYGELENFLFVSIRNGLQNLKAKHYYDHRNGSDYMEAKKNIVGFIQSTKDKSYEHPFEDLEIAEIEELIDRHIHPQYKDDYHKIKEGIYVGTARRRKIMNQVQRIYNLIMEDRVGDLEQQS